MTGMQSTSDCDPPLNADTGAAAGAPRDDVSGRSVCGRHRQRLLDQGVGAPWRRLPCPGVPGVPAPGACPTLSAASPHCMLIVTAAVLLVLRVLVGIFLCYCAYAYKGFQKLAFIGSVALHRRSQESVMC